MKFPLSGFYRKTLDSQYNVGAHLFAVLTGLIQLAFLTSVFEPEELGKWFFFLAAMHLVGLIVLPGAEQSIVRGFVQGYPGNLRRITHIRLLLSVASTVIVFLLAWFYSSRDLELGVMFFYGAILFATFRGLDLSDSFFFGTRRFRQMFWVRVVRQCSILLFVVAPVPYHCSITIFTFSMLTVVSVFNVSAMAFAYLNSSRADCAEPRLFRSCIALSFGRGSSYIASGLEAFLITSIFGLGVLGQYGVAVRLLDVGSSAVKNVIAPINIKRQALSFGDYQAAAMRDLPYLGLLGLVIYCVAALSVSLLWPLAIGQGFGDAYAYSLVMLLGVVFLPLTNYCRAGMASYRRNGLFITVNWLEGMGIIFWMILLCGWLGTWGAVIARLLAILPVAAISWRFLSCQPPVLRLPSVFRRPALAADSDNPIFCRNFEVKENVPNK